MRSLPRATFGMAAGTLLSRVTGFLKLVALGYAIRYGPLTDAYTLANTTPNIIYDLVIGGVLSATLIPVFVDRITRLRDDLAWEAISAVITVAAVALVAVTIVFELLAPGVIRLYNVGGSATTASPAVVAAERATAVSLLRMFVPQVALYGFIALTTSLLNSRKRFMAPMFSPVANNLVVTGVLVALPHLVSNLDVQNIADHRLALYLLGWGTTAGVAAQLLAQLPALRAARLHLRWNWAPRHEAVISVIRLSGWTFGFVAANQLALWVVLVLANRAHSDFVTVYNAGWTFFQLPYGIVAVSVMSAIQPDLAAAWSRGRIDSFRRRTAAGLRSTMALIVPAAIGLILLAHPLVELLLRHGRLTQSAAHLTGSVVALFALGLPGFCAFLLLMRAYQAMQDTRTVFYLYVIENGVNVAVAFALYPFLGVRGLALSVAVAYTVGAGVALWDLRRRLGGIEGRHLAASMAHIGGASVVMGVAVAFVAAALASNNDLGLLLEVAAGVAAGVIAYFGTAAALAAAMGADSAVRT